MEATAEVEIEFIRALMARVKVSYLQVLEHCLGKETHYSFLASASFLAKVHYYTGMDSFTHTQFPFLTLMNYEKFVK